MNRYCVYNDSGAILEIRTEPNSILPCSEGVSDATHYVDVASQEIKEKTEPQITSEIEGLSVTLRGVPEGALVQVGHLETVGDTDDTVVTFDIPGTYTIQITNSPPHLDTELEVTVG